jgi:DNA-binding SARP family transcriptional activator
VTERLVGVNHLSLYTRSVTTGTGAALDVRLLGPVTAERNGEPVALGGPRQRAVLARLALVAGQVVTVDRIVDDVWAGEPPPTAVNTLQSYVSLLRRALGGSSHVRREGPGYVLSLGRAELDATRFEDHVAAGRAALASDPTAALAHLEAALGEWRGPCLADVADEEWARAAVARWDDLRLAATEARFDVLLALGRHTEAVGELEREVDEHPLREGLAKRLMTALYRSGRQAEALRVFARTRELLAEELGLDPTPELVGLQTAILNHDPELAAPPRVSPTTAAGATDAASTPPAASEPSTAPSSTTHIWPHAWPATVSTSDATSDAASEATSERHVAGAPSGGAAAPAPASPVPLPALVGRADSAMFTGRERQLDALGRLWQRSLAGQRNLVLLQGEAGAGKSRLAARFASAVHAEGAIVLWGRATAEAIVPFEPMVEALRTVLRTVSPEARRRVAADRGHLALLLPELAQLVPEARTERLDATVERYMLFETVAELLRAESDLNPLLFVIDDIQWADAPSLKMIEHVMRHELPGRLMIVCTARVPGDAPTPELDRLASELERDRLLTRVGVEGLQATDVEALLRAGGRDDAVAADLREATGGNAFFVTELIAHGGDGLLGDDLPESIRTMVGVRLERLDATVTQVLNLAAVAGGAATLPVLSVASGIDTEQLLDATDRAVEAGLLVEDGAGRVGMPHALIRQAVLARLSRTRRLDLHRRIADALEHDSEPQSSPATQAHHLLQAGSLADRRRRLVAAMDAAGNALAVAAYEDAGGWVERAAELVTDHTDPRDLASLDLLRSDVARCRGDRAGAIRAARAAAAHARAAGDAVLLANAAEFWMMSLSAVGFDIGQPADPDLIELMEQAIAGLPESQVRHRVRMRSMLSSVLVPSNDWIRREAIANEALAIASADGGAEVTASAHLAWRLAHWRLDHLDERTDAVLTAVTEARRAGNVHLELTAILFALTDLLEQARWDEHLQLLADFRARAAALHQPTYEVYAQFLEAGHHLAFGDYDVARKLAADALDAGRSSHGVNAEIAHAGLMFRLALDVGKVAEMIEPFREMLERRPRLRLLQIGLAAALAESGELDEARSLFHGVVGLDHISLRDNPMFLPGVCSLVDVAARLDERHRARVLRTALEPYAGRIAVTGIAGITFGPVSRYVGVAAFTSGDTPSAERHLRAAIDTDVRTGFRAHEARARADLAAVLRARGDTTDAEREATTASAIAREIGLVLRPS